jgi:teichuronic acid biosynthesis glycosyltransferase TuaC
VAPTVIETFFDARWSNVGAMLMCLSALSVARPLGNILTAYFYASGRPGVIVRLEWASLIGVIAAIATLGRVSINWACVCVGGVFVLRTLTAMWMVRRQDGVALSEFLLPMTRPLVVCLAMVAGVSAARLALGDLTPPMRLIVEIAIGAAIYTGGVLLVDRSSCIELLRTIGPALRGSAKELPEPAAATAAFPRVLSLSTEFPNPSEPGKGLFVRARLAAIRARTSLSVVAPVAMLDYANPQGSLLEASRIPRERREGAMQVLHPRWLYPPHGGWMNAFFLCVRLLPVLVKLRARRAFDVIDAHFAHPEGIAAVLLGRMLGRPVIVTIRGSELRYRRQRQKRFWMSWALRRADRVIAVSEGLRALAIDLGVDPRRVRTVPNGIDAGVFFRRDRSVCRALHGIASGERIILCAGDLAELKGHHRVIAAVKDLNARGVRTRLLIAGGVGRSGRYAETLRQQVAIDGLADRVTFLGEATQAALAELMSAADVFCLASSTEGWPNVVNEALACGTPVVATDVGAVRQMIVSDRLGAVVPVHDGEALTEALRMALTRSWDHETISAHGRSRSWSQVADDVLEEMRAVMGRS